MIFALGTSTFRFFTVFFELSFGEVWSSMLESFRFVNVYTVTAASFSGCPLRVTLEPIHRQDNIGSLYSSICGVTCE